MAHVELCFRRRQASLPATPRAAASKEVHVVDECSADAAQLGLAPQPYESTAAELLRRGREEYVRQLAEVHVSATQRAASATLRALGVEHLQEHRIEGGLLSVDIAVLHPGTPPLALEVDGPSHFSANAPHRPMGKSLLRWRWLAARGWRVVSVPFYAFAVLGDAAQREECMLRLLRCASVAECLALQPPAPVPPPLRPFPRAQQRSWPPALSPICQGAAVPGDGAASPAAVAGAQRAFSTSISGGLAETILFAGGAYSLQHALAQGECGYRLTEIAGPCGNF